MGKNSPYDHAMNRQLWLISVLVLLLSGCSPCFRTDPLPMQKPSNRGPLEVVIKPAEDMKAAELGQLKKSLAEKYEQAGFQPVNMEDSRSNGGRSVEIALMKYEHSAPGNNGCITTGVGSSYVCPLVAPCLLLPGYYHPQFEIIAEVSYYNHGRRIFKKIISAKSTSSANIINTGDEKFRNELADTTLHNFTVAFLKEVDSRKNP